MTSNYLIEMRGITRSFPGVIANNQVDLQVEAGAIHALLGENGAGKTTLMNILYGLYQPEEGYMLLRGEECRIDNPGAAMALGIGMVHQHFMLVPVLSVAENIILGLPPAHGPFLDLAAAEQSIAELARTSGLQVDPRAKVWQLPVGVQQRVEILKFLYRGAEILILDEPTAVLTPEEVSGFFDVLRQLKAQGVTIILITHKLKEVMAISDRVTVMRDGSAIATIETSSTNPQQLARLMVGREVIFRIAKPSVTPGKTVLTIKELHVEDERGLPAVRGLNLTIREGEILGIAGVSGNGQTELTEAITGIRPVKRGEVKLYDRDITHYSPRQVIKSGIAQIPSDRHVMGSIADFSLAENVVLSIVEQAPFSKQGVLRWPQIEAYGEQLIRDFDVRASGAHIPAKWLSGGNLQKLILAREMAQSPRLLIANQPTRGLDVAAIEYVHKKLLAAQAQGAAILLISSELEEILTLSDRIVVMFEGQLIGTVTQQEADVNEIALMMTGAVKQTFDIPESDDLVKTQRETSYLASHQ